MGKQENPIKGLVCGLAAGAAASAIMDGYWAVMKQVAGERPEQKPKKGGKQQKDEPSTQQVADKVSEAVSGHAVPKKDKPAAGMAVHYSYGTLWGGVFGVLAALMPSLGLLGGLLYGAGLWLFGDEIGLRALKLAPDPLKVPVQTHAEALGAHLVYGASTALISRLLLRLLP